MPIVKRLEGLFSFLLNQAVSAKHSCFHPGLFQANCEQCPFQDYQIRLFITLHVPCCASAISVQPNQNISGRHFRIIECIIISLLIHISYYRLCMKCSHYLLLFVNALLLASKFNIQSESACHGEGRKGEIGY